MKITLKEPKEFDLPEIYDLLSMDNRRLVRGQYIREQDGKCLYCGESLEKEAPERIKENDINWKLFPKGFLKWPIHLQHCHESGYTEGAVHSYCNAVMWQYEGR